MGRTRRNSCDFFWHSAVGTPLIQFLEKRYGNDGYAVFYKTMEALARSEGHFIDLSDEVEAESFCDAMKLEDPKIFEILDLLAGKGAIDSELWKNKILWCQPLVDGFADVYKKRGNPLPEKTMIANGLVDAENPDISGPEKAGKGEMGNQSGTGGGETGETCPSIILDQTDQTRSEQSKGNKKKPDLPDQTKQEHTSASAPANGNGADVEPQPRGAIESESASDDPHQVDAFSAKLFSDLEDRLALVSLPDREFKQGRKFLLRLLKIAVEDWMTKGKSLPSLRKLLLNLADESAGGKSPIALFRSKVRGYWIDPGENGSGKTETEVVTAGRV